MPTIRAVVEKELSNLPVGQRPHTQIEQAQWLGIDPSLWSKVLRGRVRLTEDRAHYLASKLTGSSASTDSVARDLLEALPSGTSPRTTRVPTASIDNARVLFERLRSPRALLVVEYRDMPRAHRFGRYRGFAGPAGEAVASGLNFAMVSPFGASLRSDQFAPRVYHYLTDVARKTREAFDVISDEALKHAGGNADAVRGHLVLYEPASTEITSGAPGIQSRLFYAAIPSGVDFEFEVWDWVASAAGDVFVPRDAGPDSTPHDVIADQFLPITAFWRRSIAICDAGTEAHPGLPRSVGDFGEAARFARDQEDIGVDCGAWLRVGRAFP